MKQKVGKFKPKGKLKTNERKAIRGDCQLQERNILNHRLDSLAERTKERRNKNLPGV